MLNSCSGTLVDWTTDSPSFLLGGVTYGNGTLTVPTDGLYYIYACLLVESSLTASMRVGGSDVWEFFMEQQDASTGIFAGGLIQNLSSGDTVEVNLRRASTTRILFTELTTFFGLFKVT